MQSLFAIVDRQRGRRSCYGIAAEKLAAVDLPLPLAQLYGELGNMPGDRETPFPFSTQDHLIPFEFLRVQDSRLLFASENQGCWQAFTETTGQNPPVWFVAEEDEPVLEHPSLANFLVTLCLQEMTMGCPILYAGEELPDKLKACGHRVTPLWTEGLFPGYDRLLNPVFYLVDGGVLLYDKGWIGFSSSYESDQFAGALVDATRIHPPKTMPMSEYLARPGSSPIAERLYYEHLARDFQQQADQLQAKASECRRAAENAVRRGVD